MLKKSVGLFAILAVASLGVLAVSQSQADAKKDGMKDGATCAACTCSADKMGKDKDAKHAEAKHAKVGKEAPGFTLNSVTGEKHSLSDFKGQIVVLHWQSYTCPWDVAYQPMLNDVAARFQDHKTEVDGKTKDKVVFLAINSNHTENVAKMKKYHGETDMPYAILHDPGNKVADTYKAQTTPHMFIIDADGELVYNGGIEKAPMSPNKVGESDEQYLVPVLEALVNGSEFPYSKTKPKGCSVKRAPKKG